MTIKNYIFIGLGPHAKRIYYPFLEKYQAKYNIHLKLLIELENQSQKVAEFLSQRKLQPEKVLYLPNNESNPMGGGLDGIAKKELDLLIKNEKINWLKIFLQTKKKKKIFFWE